jgi:AraC family transcriptional regulator
MEIVWKNKAKRSASILLNRKVVWNDFSVIQIRGLAGEMPDHTYLSNCITLPIKGNIFTQRHTSGGGTRLDSGSPLSMCIMPVGQTVYANWENEYETLIVDFSAQFLQEMAKAMNLSDKIELREIVTQKDQLIQNLALAFLSEMENQETASQLYADSLVQKLMFHLVKNYTNSASQIKVFSGGLSPSTLRRVKEFINENLEQDLTLTDISRLAGLSSFHFGRVFRQTTGITLQRYIMNHRIEKAKELLAKTQFPLVEIGFRTGFKNQSHFTTFFRKTTSLTPKVWRANYQF